MIMTTTNNKPLEVQHNAVVLAINKLYRPDMGERELYETARGVWIIGKRRERVEYAIAVCYGIAKEVYRIHKWHPINTLEYKIRDISEWLDDDRWEFEGKVAEEEVRDLYFGREIYVGGKPVEGLQNPVRYAKPRGR